MNVASYTYQTPSPSAVQVGKLDPSSVKEEKPKEKTQTQSDTPMVSVNETLSNAKSFQSTQNILDIYV